MAIGDQSDSFQRIKSLLPDWYGDSNPLRDALITGFGYAKAYVYQLIVYAGLQTRIKTATDGWLDMIAADFFGTAVQRKVNQSDASFRNTIVINMFRERATRYAITKILTDLTGRAPTIIEPSRPADTGGLAINLALGVAGCLGSFSMPYQAFVIAYRPLTAGVPLIPGLATSPFGLGITSGGAVTASIAATQNAVADSDIYAAIDLVKPAGTIAWTRISN